MSLTSDVVGRRMSHLIAVLTRHSFRSNEVDLTFWRRFHPSDGLGSGGNARLLRL